MRDVSQLSRDVCNSLRDLTFILSGNESNLSCELSCNGSREAMRLSHDVILVRMKQCSYRVVYEIYRAMYEIHCVRCVQFITRCIIVLAQCDPFLAQCGHRQF